MTYATKDYLTPVSLAFNGMIDSCLSAILLKKQKYQVSGIYFYIEKKSFLYLENDFIKYFCLDKSKVEAKANEIGIKISLIEVSEEFEAFILEPFMASLIDLKQSNIKNIIHDFIFNMMRSYSKDKIFSFGHYCKALKQNNDYELYSHSNLGLDQSHLVKKKYLKDNEVIFPLGDLGESEKLNLVKNFELTPIGHVKEDKESEYEKHIPIDLIREFDYENQKYNPLSFVLEKERSFLIYENHFRYIKSSLFTLKLEESSHLDKSKPLKLFLKHINDLVEVKVYFKTFSRAIFESSKLLPLNLGQSVTLYKSNLKNAKVIANAKIINIEENYEDENTPIDSKL